jgi:thymidylate kinase
MRKVIGRQTAFYTTIKVLYPSQFHEKKAPGIIPAIVMYAFTLRRLRRFRRMLTLREKGFIIVADRFPQLDYPLAYDGPQLDINAQGNFIVRWLTRREHAAFEWMTQYKPDLIIRLNVDIDTAFARKPDHVRESLQKKIEITPLLTFNGAPIVDINSAQPLEQVIVEAKAAIDKMLLEYGYKKGLNDI